MSLRTVSFEATHSFTIESLSFIKIDVDTYRTRSAWNTSQNPFESRSAVYSWSFSELYTDFSTIIDEVGGENITKVQLQFSYNMATDGIGIDIYQHDNLDPKLFTALQVAIVSAVDINNIIGTTNITNNEKTLVTIDLDDTNSFFYETLTAIGSQQHVTFRVSRSSITSDGNFECSGIDLVGGSSEWRAAVTGEPSAPPLLIIQYEVNKEVHPILNMRYTTTDPTVIQSTPSNSVGGHVAQNDVYPSANIGDSINTTQTTIPIDSASSLPEFTGLASVGPEIFKYSVIDTTNHQLTGVTRAISPAVASPAGFDSFRIAEKVHYLHPGSDNLNELFDTRPTSSLVQYRCVALINTDTLDNFSIQDAFLGIVQNSNSDVQITIGVEYPRYDAKSGTSEDATTETSTTVLVDTSFTEVSGFYNGALIKLLSPVEYVLVDTFVDGEFILQTAVSSLDAGRDFVIMPSGAQTISNDSTAPNSNFGRFGGFSETEEGISINLLESGNSMNENDLFYVWIRRTVKSNIEKSDDTGAVLLFRYRSG